MRVNWPGQSGLDRRLTVHSAEKRLAYLRDVTKIVHNRSKRRHQILPQGIHTHATTDKAAVPQEPTPVVRLSRGAGRKGPAPGSLRPDRDHGRRESLGVDATGARPPVSDAELPCAGRPFFTPAKDRTEPPRGDDDKEDGKCELVGDHHREIGRQRCRRWIDGTGRVNPHGVDEPQENPPSRCNRVGGEHPGVERKDPTDPVAQAGSRSNLQS